MTDGWTVQSFGTVAIRNPTVKNSVRVFPYCVIDVCGELEVRKFRLADSGSESWWHYGGNRDSVTFPLIPRVLPPQRGPHNSSLRKRMGEPLGDLLGVHLSPGLDIKLSRIGYPLARRSPAETCCALFAATPHRYRHRSRRTNSCEIRLDTT